MELYINARWNYSVRIFVVVVYGTSTVYSGFLRKFEFDNASFQNYVAIRLIKLEWGKHDEFNKISAWNSILCRNIFSVVKFCRNR